MDESHDIDELTQNIFKQVRSFYRRLEYPSCDIDEHALNLERIDVSVKSADLPPLFGGEVYGSLAHLYLDALNFQDYSVTFPNIHRNAQGLYTLKWDFSWMETLTAEVLHMLSRIRTELLFVDEVTESQTMMSPEVLILDESITAKMRESDITALVFKLTQLLKNETPFLINSIEHFSRTYVSIREILLRYKRIIDEFVSVSEEKWNDIDFAITIRSLQVLLSSLLSMVTQNWPAILALTSENTAVQYSFFLIRFSMWDKGFTF